MSSGPRATPIGGGSGASAGTWGPPTEISCRIDRNRPPLAAGGGACLGRLSEARGDPLLGSVSVVQVLFEQGEITEAEMGHHEDQNRLLQALGGDEAPKARLGGADLAPGDALILCSDGFWENLEAVDLAELAASPPHRRRRALRNAVKKAVTRGGARADNTSVIFVGGVASGQAARTIVLRWSLVCLLLALMVLGLGWLGSKNWLQTGKASHALKKWWQEKRAALLPEKHDLIPVVEPEPPSSTSNPGSPP